MTKQGAFEAGLKVGDTIEARWVMSAGLPPRTFCRCEAVIEEVRDNSFFVLVTDPDGVFSNRPRFSLPRISDETQSDDWKAVPLTSDYRGASFYTEKLRAPWER